MAVGTFPGLQNPNKRTIRSQTNPLDKCTVFSIFPKEIEELKPTIQPGRFVLEAGRYEKPARLVVGSSSWWKELEEDQPLLEIPVSSIQVADSVVRDYCNGLLGCNMADHMPGLFFIPGEISIVDLVNKPENKRFLETAAANQKRWFTLLVKMADTLWARSGGNPITISDDMRLAAQELGLKGKEWLQDFQSQEMIKCVGCGSMRNPLYPICPSCHNIIDKALYDKLNLKPVEKVN